MRIRGRVKDGVVVFSERVPLDEGTLVTVEPLEIRGCIPKPGSHEALVRCTARWAGDYQELDRLLDEVQRMRDGDVTPERNSL